MFDLLIRYKTSLEAGYRQGDKVLRCGPASVETILDGA